MKKAGFTLVELVFSLGLLVALTACLVPPAMSARESALDLKCKTNLRALASYCLMYAQDTGYLPWGSVNPWTHDRKYCNNLKEGPLLYPAEWPSLHGIQSWQEYKTYCWDFRKKNTDKVWSCGAMFDDLGVSSIMCCPKTRGVGDNWDGNPMTGYNYNVAYLGHVEGDRSRSKRYPTALAKIKYPQRVVVFGDGGYSGGPNKFMRCPWGDPDFDGSSASLRRAGTQAFRHGKGRTRHCNMAFLDTHVESFYKPYQTAGRPGWVDEASHSAFISSGNGIYGPRGWGVADEDEPPME